MKKTNIADYFFPVLIAGLSSTAVYLIAVNLKQEELSKLTKELCDISVSFGLTLLAFSVTAFALIQLLHSKKWFDELRETETFAYLVGNFRVAVWLNASIFGIGLVTKVYLVLANHLEIWIIVGGTALMIFSTVWVIVCINTLLLLYSEGQN